MSGLHTVDLTVVWLHQS